MQLKFVKTPVFLVQEFPSVWDTQCLFDGGVTPGSILQVSCSSRDAMYDCAQYSDLCPKTLVQDFFVPVQKQYVSQTVSSGLSTRAGSGGFFHGCYVGAYFFGAYAKNYTECYPPPCNGTRVTTPMKGIWEEIAVGGVTMRAAITSWWQGAATAAPVWHVDSFWDPDGLPPNGSAFATEVTEPVEARRRLLDDGFGRQRRNARRGPPPVPWYVSRYMTNPSCRGFPWY